jgi:hypothetical protein
MKSPATTIAGLILSGTSLLSLGLYLPSEPVSPAIRVGIVCAAVSSLYLFVYYWLLKNQTGTNIAEVSFTRKFAVIAGLPISFYALCVLFRFAFQLPHRLGPEIGMLGGAICSLLVFTFCWAAPFAYVIRQRAWPPSACYAAGIPFIVVGVVFFLRDAFWSPTFPALHVYTLMAIVVAGPVIVRCQKLAFPGLTPSDFFQRRWPPSIR